MDNDTYPSGVGLRVPTSSAVVYVAVYTLIISVIVIGNALVILSFLGYRQIRTVTQNHILFGLALADFMMGASAIPMGAIVARLVISDFSCRSLTRSVLFTPAYIVGAVSSFMVMALTIDRYIAVTRALRYSVIMTPQRADRVVVIVWGIGILFGLTPILNLGGDPTQWVCELQRYEATSVEIYGIAISALVPTFLVIMLIIYARIFYIVFRKDFARRDNTSTKHVGSGAAQRGRNRATVTCAIILLTHTICWVPLSFKNVFETYFATDLRSLLTIQAVCEIFAYSNSAINPIIYAWRNPQFRDTYRKLLRRCFRNSSTAGATRNSDRPFSVSEISTSMTSVQSRL